MVCRAGIEADLTVSLIESGLGGAADPEFEVGQINQSWALEVFFNFFLERLS